MIATWGRYVCSLVLALGPSTVMASGNAESELFCRGAMHPQEFVGKPLRVTVVAIESRHSTGIGNLACPKFGFSILIAKQLPASDSMGIKKFLNLLDRSYHLSTLGSQMVVSVSLTGQVVRIEDGYHGYKFEIQRAEHPRIVKRPAVLDPPANYP
jgi:hypothetical protein